MKKRGKTWYLYILKYEKTGNYYVGATPNLKGRMNAHRFRTSQKSLHSMPSILNRSTKGFSFFWYKIEGTESTQSNSNKIENKLTEFLKNWVEEDVVVNGGCFSNPTNSEQLQIKEKIEKDTIFPLSKDEKSFLERELPKSFNCMIDEKEIRLSFFS